MVGQEDARSASTLFPSLAFFETSRGESTNLGDVMAFGVELEKGHAIKKLVRSTIEAKKQ